VGTALPTAVSSKDPVWHPRCASGPHALLDAKLPVFFLALACAALAEVAAAPSAEACTPSVPNPGVAPAVTFEAPTAPLPKDAGIVFAVYRGELTESEGSGGSLGLCGVGLAIAALLRRRRARVRHRP
jgi:hypothetical protein